MKRKILTIAVVSILLILGAATVSNAKMSIKNVTNNRQITTNRAINLGTAEVYGDGIEPNTIVDAVCNLEREINLDAASEIVDLELTYTIDTLADSDLGLIIIFAQLNGASVGEAIVVTSENESGTLSITDVTLEKKDIITILTVEIAALYFSSDNGDTFYLLDLDTGWSIVKPKAKNIHSRLHSFPLIQSLLNLPRIARLFN
jgi:hypothetical protein